MMFYPGSDGGVCGGKKEEKVTSEEMVKRLDRMLARIETFKVEARRSLQAGGEQRAYSLAINRLRLLEDDLEEIRKALVDPEGPWRGLDKGEGV